VPEPPDRRAPDGGETQEDHLDEPVELPDALRLGVRGVRWLRRIAFILVAVAVAFMWFDEQLGVLEYQPGGMAFYNYVRPAFFALLGLGALLAIKWQIAGGVVAAFAAGAISAFAINQLVGWHAALVVTLLALPGLIWVIVDLNAWSKRAALIGIVGVALAAFGGSAAGELIYERTYGPTHPESDVPALPGSALRWVWSGGVTTTHAEVRARTEEDDVETLRLAVSESANFDQAQFFDVDSRDGAIAVFDADDLTPDTQYHYAVEVDGELDTVRTGRFRTFPEGPASFRFTVGACARVGSNGSVFDAIREEEPLFHLIAGDFHYGDIPRDERDRYDEVIDLTLRQPAQSALYRSTPIGYVWDDHDYGPNDADSFSASRAAAMDAYRANVPSYELAGEHTSVFQSFDVGRVRFLLTDARSSREPGETMLGQQQLEWLLGQLAEAADEAALVVWLNPVPWVAPEEEGADHWGGYPDERRQIADAIAEHDLDLLMVSGDAHMVAIDDGTNTDYSTAGDGGFALIHSAPLDRPASIKGGPYSEGAVAAPGQYARVDIADDGDTITVDLAGRRYDGETILAYTFDVDTGP
jgi:phosphodiesterase/alkaline phosphatase D-like protein